MMREYFLPILLSFRLGTQGCLVLLLNLYPHFLDQSYALFVVIWLLGAAVWDIGRV